MRSPGPLTLYLWFLNFSAMTFGGGMVLVAMARDRLVSEGLITREEAMEMTNLSSTVPGPVGVNFAALSGLRAMGPMGAVAAVAGVLTAPFLSVLLLGGWLLSHSQLPWVRGFISGVLCASTALMSLAVADSGRYNLKGWRSLVGLGAFLALHLMGLGPGASLGISIGLAVLIPWN
ncbi:chromate transporter [Thermanaerovibrio acidaminovorans]|uniref:Chromate transporter n=1 Tax=Thermanaerovibrio acidaminovorans (strain ATCC 49978 / DSM 6589 / Su883) TaxID=525903 RepID=D1B7H5_THEAS|nr:chromate transporter [Thermanaerovibrio acidaminovorans]ACZ19966.1 Chromate transporter [Thermanaerovibrio acidaminovorans DSM 6589]